MKYLQRYRIPFSGLKNEHHVFDFDIDKRFFDEYSYSIVKDGKIKAVIEIEKQEAMMVAHFSFDGEILLPCDLCLNRYPLPISKTERLIIKFHGEEEINNETEEILVLAKNDYEIDFAPFIYEYINLTVPVHSSCSSPGETEYCDQTVLKKTKDLENSNLTQGKHDPRWDILKKIKNN